MKLILIFSLFLGSLSWAADSKKPVAGAELKQNDLAPTFTAKTHEGKDFDLSSRKGQWTVLYFYPKADTPGCTQQACAFRDSINVIRDQGADVFGVSINSVADQAAFHKKHHLNFTLIADDKGEIANLYGTRIPVISMSKRWTFIIDPNLKIRAVEKDVDPAKDAEKVSTQIKKLKETTKI
ncbi:MAG: peroxiredoxin [Bdellovibrionales bacterium]|nr:peroxiredoxin [Bdellovibrionales bacterium]